VLKRVLVPVVALMLALGAAACGDDNEGGGGGGGSGGGGGPKVGFVYVSPVKGSAWTQAWDRARQHLEKTVDADTSVVEPIPENQDVVAVMNDLIRKGNKMIFATAFGYQPFVAQVAEENPDVNFVVIGPWSQKEKPPKNVASVYANLWEVRYATGIVAGSMTKSNQLGFMSAFSIPSVVAGINGFQLGAKSVNPDVKTRVVLTNNWYDPPRSTQAAESLASRGADVIAQHEDSTGPLLGARKAGVFGIGSEADTSNAAPETYLTGSVYNWNDYAERKTKQAIDGNFTSEETNGNLKSGLVTLGPINEKVPADVRKKVDDAVAKLKSGELIVFTGPLRSNDGKEVLKDGEQWKTPAEVYENSTFFVEGIIGKVEK
jgi:basic membrane protein A